MGNLWTPGASMKNPHAQKKLNPESAPASKGRRSFVVGMATLGAGLAGSVILPATAIAQATPKAPPENKIYNKRLRTHHSHCFRRGNGRRNNRWENPRLQAERCVHFQRCTLWCLHGWREALHAASQARTVDGNSQRAAVWPCLSIPGLRAL